MSVFLQPIYTQTVGSGGVGTVTFNNVPQTFTDLKLVVSSRSTTAAVYQNLDVNFNGNSASTFSSTRLRGTGSTTYSDRYTSASILVGFEINDAANATANTFSSIEYYIPNYTSSNFKQVIVDGIWENNATAAYQTMLAGLWRDTSAISSIAINGYNHAQYSTFSLYGVLRQGI